MISKHVILTLILFSDGFYGYCQIVLKMLATLPRTLHYASLKIWLIFNLNCLLCVNRFYGHSQFILKLLQSYRNWFCCKGQET